METPLAIRVPEPESTTATGSPIDSPMMSSLYRATTTIDDLTLALSNFSRAQTPEPPNVVRCCCERAECENLRAWSAFKSKLESRLILSAEVGQALLQKYEAYVRRHEASCRLGAGESNEGDASNSRDSSEFGDHADSREAALIRRTASLERQLTQALVNAEVTESANNQLLGELQEARAGVARLSAHHARSVGLDARLKTAVQEREDMQQERDTQTENARLAEQRTVAMKDKCLKLQTEIRRLQRDLQNQQSHRLELSEEILQDARSRLEILQQAQVGQNSAVEESEVTKVLETLVADNEDLKRGNGELQSLLRESRNDVRSLQEEVEELRAGMPPPSNPDRTYMTHRHTNSAHSSVFSGFSGHLSPLSSRFPSDHILHSSLKGRSASVEPGHRHYEPLTPETDRQPLSPAESVGHDTGLTSLGSHSVSFSMDEDASRDERGLAKPKAKRSLLLLTRSRGVQTEVWAGQLSPLPPISDGLSPNERSESSSLTDASQTNALSNLLDRAASLCTRMMQADALTLTNRLKRQHLAGADVVNHLSRTTVSAIVAEAAALRAYVRGALEDERAVLTASRKDVRALLKLLRELFGELGQMRVTLNDVVFDPAVAHRVREQAMNPTKGAHNDERERGRQGTGAAGAAMGWIAPLSKLFGAPAAGSTPDSSTSGRSATGDVRSGSRGRRPPLRVVPKLQAALSASTMTVNVEFSGSGVGRASAVTSAEATSARSSGATIAVSASGSGSSSQGVMGIFAGAPRVDPDAWVVLPKDREPQRARFPRELSDGSATIGRSLMRSPQNRRLSRQVDAVIDGSGMTAQARADADEEADALGAPAGGMLFHPTLLDRTLRPRGLSDSSLRSTFLAHGEDAESPRRPVPVAGAGLGALGRQARPDRQSVLAALGKRVASFRFGSPMPPSAMAQTAVTVEESSQVPVTVVAPSPVLASGSGSLGDSAPGSRSGTPTLASTSASSIAAKADVAPVPVPVPVPVRSRRGDASVERTTSPGLASYLPTMPNLASWAAAAETSGRGMGDESMVGGDRPYYGLPIASSPPDAHRTWRDTQGRDF